MTLIVGLDTKGQIENEEISALFGFTSSDPFVITVVFDKGDEKVIWNMGRELIDRATKRSEGECGKGDVIIRCLDTTLSFTLRSPGKPVVVTFDRCDIEELMREINKRVPHWAATSIVRQQLDETLAAMFG